MNKQKQAVHNDIGTLAEDARALMAATADVAGEQVNAARQRLAAALESCKALYGQARTKAIDGARATDQIVRENPYQFLGVALGVGAIIGYIAASRCSRNRDGSSE